MSNAIFHIAIPDNEPVLSYAPDSPEREELQQALREAKGEVRELPAFINGERVLEGEKVSVHPPHEVAHTLGHFYRGTQEHVHRAIDAALAAKADWEALPWQSRAAVFLRAADLLAGPYRACMNAATMLGQSKNAYQSEIDAVAELCDFFRFNAYFLQEIYREQPLHSPAGTWNRLEYRALEGFVLAITPFNFTAIAGNLPCAPALMGNVVVWKPSPAAMACGARRPQSREGQGQGQDQLQLQRQDRRVGRAEGETHRRTAARMTDDGFCFALPILRSHERLIASRSPGKRSAPGAATWRIRPPRRNGIRRMAAAGAPGKKMGAMQAPRP